MIVPGDAAIQGDTNDTAEGTDAWCTATFENDRGLIFECERAAGHEGPHRGAITQEWIDDDDD